MVRANRRTWGPLHQNTAERCSKSPEPPFTSPQAAAAPRRLADRPWGSFVKNYFPRAHANPGARGQEHPGAYTRGEKIRAALKPPTLPCARCRRPLARAPGPGGGGRAACPPARYLHCAGGSSCCGAGARRVGSGRVLEKTISRAPTQILAPRPPNAPGPLQAAQTFAPLYLNLPAAACRCLPLPTAPGSWGRLRAAPGALLPGRWAAG